MTGDARDDAQPLYLRIYEYLRGEISSSRLRPGDRLPSEKELAVKFGVSRITSKHALELLAGDGSIERVPGKGSFVRTRPAVEPESPQRRGVTKPDCLGLVIPGFDDAFGTTLVCGIEEKCEELGYRLILRRSRDLLEREQRAIEELLAAGVGGILLLPVHGEHYNPVILRLVLEKFPLVLVDRYLRGLAISSVGTDNVAAARQGVDSLIALGHRSIAFVSASTENTSTIEDRLEGFVRCHADHGLSIDGDLVFTGLTSAAANGATPEAVENDIARVRARLETHPEITAVFAVEHAAAQIAREAAARLGRRIPGDLSLLCFDSPRLHAGSYELTHIRQNEREMGLRAVTLAHEQLQGNGEIRKILLDAELIEGRSTGARG